MQYWTCSPDWPGETVYIVGSGPSLLGADLEGLRGRRVIAVNNAIERVPFADLMFFADTQWYRAYAYMLASYKGTMVTVSPSVRVAGVKVMRQIKPPPGLADEPNAVIMLRTSFQSAINIAVHRGAKRLVFIGLDGKAADTGRTHFHKPHPFKMRADVWQQQRQCLEPVAAELAARGIDVTLSLIHI